MDNRIILQVPMSKALRKQAEDVAEDVGFSSLQEVIRLLIRKFARRELSIKVEDVEVVNLSSSAKSRLKKIEKDISEGKNLYRTEGTADFLKNLRQ